MLELLKQMLFKFSDQIDEQQRQLLERYIEELEGTARREWPSGRLSADDDGAATFLITTDPNRELVRIEFSTPTTWIAMSPQEAVEIAQMLVKHARNVSRSPIVFRFG